MAAANSTKTAAGKTAETPKETEPDRTTLTLQQKFVEIRKAIPAIQQQAHSDGVKYKFAKIYDVYKLMAPALNEWGVNFDITEETATRHAENGDEIYYSNFVQHTRSGDRVVWIYEAELTIRWTNADNPDDCMDVTLHAIGTNDSGPDKAKGSAWTYCLKYYFFEKFNIDQGDDDPDNYDHATEPQTAQNGSGDNTGANNRPSNQKGSHGQKQSSQRLSEAQLNPMYRKAEDAGMTREQTDARILQCYGLQNPAELTRQQYDGICEQLDASVKGGH